MRGNNFKSAKILETGWIQITSTRRNLKSEFFCLPLISFFFGYIFLAFVFSITRNLPKVFKELEVPVIAKT